MTEQEMQMEILKKLFAENARLKAAGVKRNDPSTWRPDLTKTTAEYRREIESENA